MKRWIHATTKDYDFTPGPNVIKFDKQLRNHPNIKILTRMTGEEYGDCGGYVYVLTTYDGDNVYRVFVDDNADQLIFQILKAKYDENTNFNSYAFSDNAKDLVIEDDPEAAPDWYDIFIRWLNKAEYEIPNYTR